ncbi:MAG TPA: efflux transporter outer membrane subunit [Dyella sp.]|uniref:efflux transporter outer membrane subunit n=1 Tax=Dyella sp. TaxID=1869338 RepID=UPI002F9555BF
MRGFYRTPLMRPQLVYPWLACAVLAVTGCAPPVRPPTFVPRNEAPLAGLPVGKAGWPQPGWWKRYGDAQLDRLVDLAMRDSPDLEQAQARYLAALRAVDMQRAQLNPQVQGLLNGAHGYSDVDLHGQAPGTSGSAQGISVNPGRSWSNTGVAGALLRWDLDIWGKQKAAVAAAAGQANAAKAERATVANSLQYNVAVTYVDWLTLQSRVALARDAERTAVLYSELAAKRVRAGLDDPQTLDTAQAQLAQLRRTTVMLEGAAALDIAQLAALTGISPQKLGELSPRALPQPDAEPPPDARLGLIARRPDIVAARWQIEAASRSIDQARAAYYPDVSLVALAAYLRIYPDLGSGTRIGATVGNVGPSVQLPLFSGGRLRAQLEASQAQLDNAVAAYNRAVVQAAHDVAQQVLSLQQLNSARQQQDRELAAREQLAARADKRRRQGIDDDRPYLASLLQVDQQHDSQLQLQGQMLAADLSLIHALGGGYRAENLSIPPTTVAKDDIP